MMPTEPRSIHPQRVHSVIIPINLPSLARAERTSVPRKNSPSDHASACIRRARSTTPAKADLPTCRARRRGWLKPTPKRLKLNGR